MSFVTYTPQDLKTQMTTGALGTALTSHLPPSQADLEFIFALLMDANGDFAGEVPNSPIANADFLGLIKGSELANLTTSEKEDIQIYLTPGTVPIGSANVQDFIENVFGPESGPTCPDTYSNMLAEYNRPAGFIEARYGAAVAASFNLDRIQEAWEST